MYDPTNGFFTLDNLRSLARACVPTCDTWLDSLQSGAAELGPNWRGLTWIAFAGGQRPQATLFGDELGNQVLAIGGLGEPSDFVRAFRGSLTPAQHPKIAGVFNSYGLLWEAAVRQWLTDFAPTPRRTFVAVGHSMGGTVAPLIARMVMQYPSPPRVGCFTMGSPRFTNAVGARALVTVPMFRLMNHGDIVPAVPPRFYDAPAVYPLLSAKEIATWLSYVHVAGGVRFDSSSNLTVAETPSGYISPLTQDLRNFWECFSTGNLASHAVSQYADRLDTAFNMLTADRGHNLPAEAAPEPVVKPAVIREVETAARDWLQYQRGQQTRVPAGTTRAMVRIKKIRRQWFVYIGETSYYNATSKRDAVGVARAVRNFGRQYLQNPALFPDASLLPSLFDDAG